MQGFNEARFELQVNKALAAAQKVLDNTRTLQLPSEIPHAYEDKYLLAEFTTNIALASVLSSLLALGLEGGQVKKIQEWAQTRNVTIQFISKEACVFEKEHKYDVDSASSSVIMRGVDKIFSHKTVTTITEYWWRYKYTWELSVYPGTDIKSAIVFRKRKGKALVKTSSKQTPYPVSRISPPINVNISFLLKYLPPDVLSGGLPFFFIDRSLPECHTPSRNPQTTAARDFFDHVHAWAKNIRDFFTETIFSFDQFNVRQLCENTFIFSPLVPLFDPVIREENTNTSIMTAKRGTGVVLGMRDINAFLAEQKRSINERFSTLAKQYPEGVSNAGGGVTGVAFKALKQKMKTNPPPLISVIEAQLVTLLTHSMYNAQFFSDVIDFIERLLYRQIIAALGQEVNPTGFAEYITTHYRDLFQPEYQPQPFAYSIRRVEHDPEGALSIEENNQPISTLVRHQIAEKPMGFDINAGTKIQFYGHRYVHACVRHQFAGQAGPSLKIAARARQFSSFILVLGKVLSVDEFLPSHAVIVRDKDDLLIPLTLETIPSAKEFAAAVQSLSPEQLRFAKAFRSMQLSSTLFGICVLQIKPQLEKLLNLNRDSLTKEIELTQHLMELFIKYQISSDLLSYGGKVNVTTRCKLKRVQNNVEKVRAMIAGAEKTELRDLEQERTKAILSRASISESSDNEEGENYDEEEGGCDEDDGDDGCLEKYEAPRAKQLSSRSAPAQIQQQAKRNVAVTTSTSSSTAKPQSQPSAPKPSGGKQAASASAPPPPPPSATKKAAEAPAAKRKRSVVEKEVQVQEKKESQAIYKKDDDETLCDMNECELAPNYDESYGANISMDEDEEEAAEEEAIEIEPEQLPAIELSTLDEPQSEDEADVNYQPEVVVHTIPAKPMVDFAKIPAELEAKLGSLDPDGALRPTILNTAPIWTKKSQQGLLGGALVNPLTTEEQKKEKNDAFDLLDALSRSGSLPFDEASLHVIVCSTHCFDETVMNCLVKKNINPIEKVERSLMIVASTVHGVSTETLVKSVQLPRVKIYCPTLFRP